MQNVVNLVKTPIIKWEFMFYNENPEGKIHHIYNRGVDKRKIFITEFDYSCFISTLQVRNEVVSRGSSKRYVSILAYCLMPNHYHLLVEELIDEGISRFMSRVGNSYTKTFNSKYHRSGRLFESQYKSVRITCDGQLIKIIDYIHQNPVRAGIVGDVSLHSWSSWKEYQNLQCGICSNQFVSAFNNL